ncbi:hypothetical protein GYH30_025872 [Glycine max]|nr:hypothetical protein GYH30_025872 [Glycine max]
MCHVEENLTELPFAKGRLSHGETLSLCHMKLINGRTIIWNRFVGFEGSL